MRHEELICSRCRQPLVLHESFLKEIPASTIEDIVEILGEDSREILTKMSEFSLTESDKPDEGDAEVNEGTSSVLLREAMGRSLFELTSEALETDNPICGDCAELVMQELTQKMSNLSKENSEYRRSLEELSEHAEEKAEEKVEDEDLKELEGKKKDLLAELEVIREERNELQNQLVDMENNTEELARLEEEYWIMFNDFQSKMFECDDQQESLSHSITEMMVQLKELNKVNVLNDCFHIWHEGHFGTINGFRLGRLPSVPVEWPEINAALGQVALLVLVVSKRLNYKFEEFELVMRGNYALIRRKSQPNKIYELYNSGEQKLKQIFSSNKFDIAMSSLIGCIAELCSFICSLDSTFHIPYNLDVSAAKISGISASLSMNSEHRWTKACKYLLTDLKWILVWISKRKR